MDVNQLIENWSQNQTIATIVGGIVVLLAGVLITKYLLKDDSKYSTKDIKEVANLIDGLRGKGETPPFTLEDYKRLEDENRRLKGETQTAEIKLRLAAIALAKEAAKIALEGLGKIPEAKEKFDQAMAIFQDPEAANLYGQFLYRTGDLDNAIRQCEIVKTFGERTGNKKLLAVGTGNLGVVYQIRGNLDKAEENHLKSLELNEELDRKEGMADNYGNLGNVCRIRGDLDKAEEYQLKASELNKELGNKVGMAANYGNLGVVYQIRGDLDKAEEYFLNSLKLHQELDKKEGMASDYGNLGIGYQIRGDIDKAEGYYLKALVFNKELGKKEGIALNKWNLSIIKEEQGKLEEALLLKREVEELCLQVGMPDKLKIAREEIKWLEQAIAARKK